MTTCVRAKRVSDPLDERVRARLLSYDDLHLSNSSGSEHNADDNDDGLDEPLFLGLDEPATAEEIESDNTEDRRFCARVADTVTKLLDPARVTDGGFCMRLQTDVKRAAVGLSSLRSDDSWYKRGVMAALRWAGYNAGLCKAKWAGSGGGFTTGSHEYIDVTSGKGERYIVDLDFGAQFAVARATEEYEVVVAALPRVMVGREEEVRAVVKAVAEAARRSLKSTELSVPPWRKSRYLITKWFGPYRRTVNSLPVSAASGGVGHVKCRTVGFQATGPIGNR